MSAQTDDGVPGSVQANVALEGGSIPLPFALPAAATRTVAVVAALPGREPSSAGRPAVTREPVIRGRHSVYFPNEERNEASQPAAARPELTLAISGNGCCCHRPSRGCCLCPRDDFRFRKKQDAWGGPNLNTIICGRKIEAIYWNMTKTNKKNRLIALWETQHSGKNAILFPSNSYFWHFS